MIGGKMMLKQKRKQAGMTVTSWVFIIAIALFFALLAMNMVPSYMEFYSIKNVMQSLKEDPQTNKASTRDLRNAFYRRLDINGVYDFDKNSLKIGQEEGKRLLEVKYEIRKPVAGNVDVVMSFHNKVTW